MDRMQIILGLALNVLEIPIDLTHYREICNVTYMARCLGLYISPARIELPANTNQANSIRSHEEGGHPSRSLVDDVEDMNREIAGDTDLGYDSFRGWHLEDANIETLLTLKPYIGKTIPQEFLDAHPAPEF
jgi:hypothetical protein